MRYQLTSFNIIIQNLFITCHLLRIKMRVFVCFLGVFVSNGLARFGYVVLIPLLILSGSLTPHQSFQLGIAVLMGYVFGSF